MTYTKNFTIETVNPYGDTYTTHKSERSFEDAIARMMEGGYCIIRVELVEKTFDTDTFKMTSKVIKTARRQYDRALGWYPVITEG